MGFNSGFKGLNKVENKLMKVKIFCVLYYSFNSQNYIFVPTKEYEKIEVFSSQRRFYASLNTTKQQSHFWMQCSEQSWY